MTNEELVNLRKEKSRLIDERDKFISLLYEKIALEQSESVKRYFELEEELSNFDTDYTNKTRESVVNDLASRTRITNTNNIYVYMGTYSYNHSSDIEHGSTDYRVNKNDEQANYSQYRNLEDGEYVNVSPNERENFENNNIVIIPKTMLNEKYYYDLRKKFIGECIKYGQEYAIGELIKNEDNSIKRIDVDYFSNMSDEDIINFVKYLKRIFTEVDIRPVNSQLNEMVQSEKTLQQLNSHGHVVKPNYNLQELAKTIAQDGFIENYCLDEQEQKQLKKINKK